MGRKITMRGMNAQYIEHRAADAAPDNEREIIMEGDEAVYQEYAYGQDSHSKDEEKPMEDAVKEYQKEVARKLLMDNAEYVEPIASPEYTEVTFRAEDSANAEKSITDVDAIAKCFKFNSKFVRRSIGELVAAYYHGNYANLALIEITLFHHQYLKRRNSHKAFVTALAAWGILSIANDKELGLTVMGVADKYKRLPEDGYEEWDDNHKTDREVCKRMGDNLGPTMKYQR